MEIVVMVTGALINLKRLSSGNVAVCIESEENVEEVVRFELAPRDRAALMRALDILE